MKKLIELDAALDALREVIVPAEDIGFGDESTDGYNDGIYMAVAVVSGVPTVDAVRVVRCKDCKYWRRDTDHTCKEHSLVSPMLADGFCSRGERKDDDGNG